VAYVATRSDSRDDAAEVPRDGHAATAAGEDDVVGGSLTNALPSVRLEAVPGTRKAEPHRSPAEPGSREP
jgi:hypothetical protein